jgi:cytochrome P450 family 109
MDSMEGPPTPSPAGAPTLPRALEDIPRVFDWFATMRETRPVARDERTGLPAWHVYRYEDVATVLTDHARFSSQHVLMDHSLLSDTLVSKDPPDHRKLRNLVNLAFTPRAVARLSGRIAETTQELLDAVRARGEMDVVSDLAFPLPARVIAELLGVPRHDWDIFRRWAALDAGPGRRNGFRSSVVGEVHAYFSDLLEERRRRPREDLLTALSAAEIDGERLSEHELVSFCFLLLFAGQETTKNLIANFVLTLSDHPEAADALVRQPHLMPGAVEEVLRYLPPVWFLLRRTRTAVELGGVRIPAEELVIPWMASANRDSTQFPDAGRFDVRREQNRHLSFGHGVHFCIGAPLTRLEANVALPMMLEQLRDLRVVRRETIAIRAGIVFILERLPVTFRVS